MPSRIDPYAATNAFASTTANLQNLRDARQQNALRSTQLERAESLNALSRNPNATAEQYVRAGDVNTGNALAGMQADQQAQRAQAFPRVGQITAQISQIADPAQKRTAFRSAIQSNAQLFEALGIPADQQLAKLDTLDDGQLQEALSGLARFAPQAAPTDVAPGHSLVRPDANGGFSPAYTAPNAPTGEGGDGFSLSPGQVRFDKNGKRIAGVEAPKPGLDPEQAKVAAQLRDDWRQDSKVFQGVADSYQRIQDSASDPSAAGDLALIFNYMKVLDPGSTVREGEFATAQSAGSAWNSAGALYNRVMNGERLTQAQRTDFTGRATKLYKGQEGRFKTQVLDRYQGLAKRYGVDPSEFSDPRAQVPQEAAPPPKQAPPAALQYLQQHPESAQAFQQKYGYLPQ